MIKIKKNTQKILFVGLFIASSIFLFYGNAQAFTLNVDGALEEWGVTPYLYGQTNWMPYSGINYKTEDDNPVPQTQEAARRIYPYDAEAMYLTTDDTNLYFALVTTFPSIGHEGHATGDIAFDFGIDGSYDYGISSINRNGLTQGNLYSVSEWYDGFWGDLEPLADPSHMKDAYLKYAIPELNFTYNNIYYYLLKGNHYVIEGYMPQAAFGNDWGKDFRMHWAMSCGNDYLNLDYHENPIPEPATMALLGLGLLGLYSTGRKRKKSLKNNN